MSNWRTISSMDHPDWVEGCRIANEIVMAQLGLDEEEQARFANAELENEAMMASLALEEEEKRGKYEHEVDEPVYIDESTWKWNDGICYTYGEKEEKRLESIKQKMGLDKYKGTPAERPKISTAFDHTSDEDSESEDRHDLPPFVKWTEKTEVVKDEDDFVYGKKISDQYRQYFNAEDHIETWGGGKMAQKMAKIKPSNVNMPRDVYGARKRFLSNMEKNFKDYNIPGALYEINTNLAKWNYYEKRIGNMETDGINEAEETKKEFEEAKVVMNNMIEQLKKLMMESTSSA